ncbi:ATP-dependent helicase NAM7 [Grifola frondosa]|uniref:ATP-dependent helicase NAM7 n=1 Tax=Grifola frondosa TaxID=5627 RepID=A0A1C7M6H5_GRIFR|nr:ATP-dependent helicase NAM7 [Grifola frondosa]
MPPKPKPDRFIDQTLIDERHPTLHVQELVETKVTPEVLEAFFKDIEKPRRIGLAPAYAPSSGNLTAMAIAVGRPLLRDWVLCNEDNILFGFEMAPLTAALFHDRDLRIVNGVDIQSACPVKTREPLEAIRFAVGDRAEIFEENIVGVFEQMTWDPMRTTPLAQQAWMASYLPTIGDMEERFRDVKRINTRDMDETHLSSIAQLARGQERLEAQRSTSISHEFSQSGARQRNAQVQSTRFQNRIQSSSATMRLTVLDPESGAEIVLQGRTRGVDGRSAEIQANGNLEGRSITGITTTGPARSTLADTKKAAILLQLLQGNNSRIANPFSQYIQFRNTTDDFTWPDDWPTTPPDASPDIVSTRPLNDSQSQAIQHMLSLTNSSRVTMIQGPPGTGKTTVIAAYVQSAIAAGCGGIWLLAQSNVAVKNIAEKLADVGFLNWRLLTSTDFHHGWHEHLYNKISKNVITSGQFSKLSRRDLQGCQVILCTLSMLSHLLIKKFTSVIPVTYVVIDEASQIAVANYLPPLSQFSTVRKMCFIGDNKQCQNTNENIKSVFELPHICSSTIFLNIQYRMPPQIGAFISAAVYDGQLQSNPLHPVPIGFPACYFVDVENSRERQHDQSWHNPSERQAVLKLAEKLEMQGKSYRIITPYDPQRDFLEKGMKQAGLQWQDRCFCVDSFQGNEDDYIIISLVRSQALGFIADLHRTNVMLTRCKRGMFIFTSWDFLFGVGSESLVGEMARDLSDDVWLNMQQVEEGCFEL